MQLPKEYFEYTPADFPSGLSEFHTLRGFRKWILENSPSEIEMNERQFWHFTELQPLVGGTEQYWRTFNGKPIMVPDMTETQHNNLGV